MDVMIYTGPGCMSCQRAVAYLSDRGVAFVERSLAEDARAMEELMALGARRLPVVRIGQEIVSGFDPARMSALLGLTEEGA